MVKVIKLTSNVDTTEPNSVVQYSYPMTTLTNTPGSYEYFPNFYGLNPNFSASFKNTYISGVCKKMTFTRPTHNLNVFHDGELVIEHIKSDNNSFFVVIPLIFKSQKSSQIDILLETSEKNSQKLDLNLDLKTIKTDIICYQIKNGKNKNDYVFVFENPILIKNNILSGMNMFNKFDEGKNFFRIQSGQNIEDEIECEYVTETDKSSSTVENQKMVTNIFVWVLIVLGLFLCALYMFAIVSKKLDVDTANNIYLGIGVVAFTMLLIYIRLFTNTTTKKIQYGSMTIFSILIMLLSILAVNNYFVIPSIVATP